MRSVSLRPIRLVAYSLLLVELSIVSALGGEAAESFPFQPSGVFQVGTRIFDLVDESRLEAWTNEDGDHRSFVTQIWYPVDVGVKGERAPYYPNYEALVPELSAVWGPFTPDGFGFYEGLRTNSLVDAPIASSSERFPLIVFSHGMRAFSRSDYTALFEELASHGYVVAAIDHPYTAIAAVLPDGTVTAHNATRWVELQTDEVLLETQFPPSFRSEIHTWAADQAFMVEWLQGRTEPQGDGSVGIAAATDFERVGVAGHSLGGTSAATACRIYSVFEACMNIHGGSFPWPFLGAEFAVIPTPFMYLGPPDALSEEDLEMMGEESFVELLRGKWSSSFIAELTGASHVTFSDKPLFYSAPPVAGDYEDPATGYVVVLSVVRSFFDVWLKGADPSTLAETAKAQPLLTIVDNSGG